MLGLTLQQFQDWWGAPSVLCSVHGTDGGLRKLSTHWTTAAPVRLPPPTARGLLPAEQRAIMLDDGDVDLGLPIWTWVMSTPLTCGAYCQPLPCLQFWAWHWFCEAHVLCVPNCTEFCQCLQPMCCRTGGTVGALRPTAPARRRLRPC